ncbi:MAG: hypothetical protein ACRET2_08725 [Steroidobacteraceae bacterium]
MSRFPEFFAAAPVLRLYDPLAEFLGAEANGMLEYRYVDMVRLAGHSCPTVASAFLSVRAALLALYGQRVPERGRLLVEMRDEADDGVTGVIAAVAGAITGAAGPGGFAGIAGRFVRCGLLRFGASTPALMRLTRTDEGTAVEVEPHLERVPGDPHMGELLRSCATDVADEATRSRFRELWQARVRALLLEHADDPEVFEVQETRKAPREAGLFGDPKVRSKGAGY